MVDDMAWEYEYIVLDIETTGLNPAHGTSFHQGGIKGYQAAGGFDEILQLAIVDPKGQTLFYDSFKPEFKKQWSDAQRLHGITPSSVQDKQDFSKHRADIQRVIDAAGFVVAYNVAFDLKFLQAQGINLKRKPTVCVMQEFAPIFGKKGKGGQRLSVAASRGLRTLLRRQELAGTRCPVRCAGNTLLLSGYAGERAAHQPTGLEITPLRGEQFKSVIKQRFTSMKWRKL